MKKNSYTKIANTLNMHGASTVENIQKLTGLKQVHCRIVEFNRRYGPNAEIRCVGKEGRKNLYALQFSKNISVSLGA